MLIWLFSHLSFYYIHILFLFGVVLSVIGFFLGFIPFVSLYRLQFKILGILVIFMSLYLEGGLAANTEWVVKMQKIQQDINNIETNSGNIIKQVSADYQEQLQDIHDSLIGIQTRIKTDKDKLDKDCKPSTDVIDILNHAATNPDKAEK
jgi:hypothetical protein